jgi:type I restriction enzyme S subunit
VRWPTIRLSELVEFHSGGTPSKAINAYWDGDVPWFSAKDFKRRRLFDSIDHISNHAVERTGLRKLPPGTIALVVRGMILAHTVPISVIETEAAVNQDVKALIPKRQVDGSFLAAMLRAQHTVILSKVSTAAHGTKKLETRVLGELEIPLPPLDEQRRIAAILDQADAIRAKRRQVLAHLDSLTQAVFQEMFGSVAGHVPFAALVDEFRYGTSGKSGQSGFPTLRIPNVVGGAIDTHEIKTVEVDAAEFRRLQLRGGDLLFVRTNGNPDNVGRCSAFDASVVQRRSEWAAGEWIYASYLIRARLLTPTVPAFVAEFFASKSGRRQLRSNSKTSAGQYNINIAGLSAVEVPLVAPQAQQSFADRTNVIRAHRTVQGTALATDDALFASLQSRAFKGEL